MAYRVLMVCMGNICRSPTAEGVLRHKLAQVGLGAQVEVASAGTHASHRGEPPDRRSAQAAQRRGYDLSALRAKSLTDAGWAAFDLVLAMDSDNLHHLKALAADAPVPPALQLLTAYAPRHAATAVPDPYYGAPEGFERVLDIIEDACDGVVRHLQVQLKPS
jgi:protein-tyrosine phosphatase